MKQIYLLLVLLASTIGYSQTNGISYQALILNPNPKMMPGVNEPNTALANQAICLQFVILDEEKQVEYQETLTTNTDELGMVNVIIGSGSQTGGYAIDFKSVSWNAATKNLKVSINTTGSCGSFAAISDQVFNAVPFAFTATNVTGVVAIANGGTNATTVANAKINLNLGNVDNTSDNSKPISNATQTALNTKAAISGQVFTGAVAATNLSGLNTGDQDLSSLATNLALGNKVDKVTAKSLLLDTEITRLSTLTNSDTNKAYVDAQDATNANAIAAEKNRALAAEDVLSTNVEINTAKVGITTTQADAIVANTSKVGITSAQASEITANMAKVGYTDALVAANSAVVANTAKVGITTQQTNNITANTTKVGYTDALVAANSAVAANTAKVGYTDALVSANTDVVANTSKVGITSVQASEIKANTAKVGITLAQTTEITANTAKVGYTEALVAANTDVAANTAKVGITSAQAIEITANTAKVGYTEVLVSANTDVVANTAKVGITSAQTTEIIANTAKVGYTDALVSANTDVVANTSKVGITSAQANEIISNTNNLDLKANIASPTFTGTVSGITKTMVGLGNVDNISDLNKPISTATQSGLDLKADLASPTFTGTPTLPSGTIGVTQAAGDNSIKLATTAFVSAAASSSNFVDLTNNQTIAGIKTFSSDVSINGLTIGRGNFNENSNTAIGLGALGNNAGYANTAIGRGTLAANIGGNGNTALGYIALSANTVGSDNIAIGTQALSTNLTGSGNIAVGINALYLNNGNYNTAIGNLTLQNNTSGSNNIGLGPGALYYNTTASNNVGIGKTALQNTTTGGSNTAVGNQAMYANTSGDVNTAVGESALVSNTTGRYNTSVGVQSQEQNTNGQSNTAIGVAAIDRNSSGSNNAVLGAFAGRYIGDGSTSNTAINNSVLIGSNSKPLANNANNEIVIGSNAIGNGSNTIQLGNTAVTNVKTSGTITAGAVTYPNTHNSINGQVLTTNASGLASWQNSIQYKQVILSSNTNDQTPVTVGGISIRVNNKILEIARVTNSDPSTIGVYATVYKSTSGAFNANADGSGGPVNPKFGTTIANANVGTWSSLLDSANGVTQEVGDYYFKLEADLSVYNSSKTYKLTVLIDGWGKVIMRLIYYAE